MTAQASLLELNLDTEARLVAGAHAASEVFRILQQAAVKCAARSAVFLIRKGRIRGWSCTGYTEEILGAQRTFDRPLEASFLERFDSSGQTRGSAIDFGQPSCAESFGCVVQLRGQPIAMLLLERPGNDTPWEPAALNVLVTVAQLRLELDLVQRKLETLSGRPPRAPRPRSRPHPRPPWSRRPRNRP